jgi:hypothetical protein
VVTRDVMLPPGLFGAHSKNFLVLADVPAPRGNAGHGCLAFTAYNGGPAAMLLDRQIQALTGRNIDSLRGAYKLREVIIR